MQCIKITGRSKDPKTTGNTNSNSLGFSLLSRWRWTLLFSCLVLCVLAFFLPFFVVCYPWQLVTIWFFLPEQWGFFRWSSSSNRASNLPLVLPFREYWLATSMQIKQVPSMYCFIPPITKGGKQYCGRSMETINFWSKYHAGKMMQTRGCNRCIHRRPQTQLFWIDLSRRRTLANWKPISGPNKKQSWSKLKWTTGLIVIICQLTPRTHFVFVFIKNYRFFFGNWWHTKWMNPIIHCLM